MQGLEHGIEFFKFFPAATSGGVEALKAFAGPFSQLRFCPTGGINLNSAPNYLALKNVVCIGGSWITPTSAIQKNDWETIEKLAREAVTALRAK
jgi:2-dehydro-3-deoxyphosphogluconate aldolase/(4S)-4-hydroxy-2-oxoglutarate aldolase